MKLSSLKIALLAALATSPAHAGFRDPVSETVGGRAAEIQFTPRSAGTTSASPQRVPAAANHVYGPAPSPAGAPSSQQPKANVPLANRGPVPKAPSLPGVRAPEVQGILLPSAERITTQRDPLPALALPSRNREQILDFSRRARGLPAPDRSYLNLTRGQETLARFAWALQPQPHRQIRTPLSLSIEKLARIRPAPAPIQYENMVKRMDALFDGLELDYPPAIQALWELSQSSSNARPLQARDALFSAIVTKRAGWESLASNQLTTSARKRVEADGRYAQILWAALDEFTNVSHIDRVVASVNPTYVKLHGPVGDKANYALARRLMAAPVAGPLKVADVEALLQAPVYRERLTLLRALAESRQKGAARENAMATLTKLEAEGQPEVRGEARLALARLHLQEGASGRALDLYRQVVKDGQNRLEVMTEQAFAELKSGYHQESLGKAVALQSPYFRYGFAPDVHLIDVISRKAMCDFGGAEATLQRFHEQYGAELAAIQELLGRGLRGADFYEELVSYHALENPLRFQRYLLRVTSVMENQKTMNGALRELATADLVGRKRKSQSRPAGWDTFLSQMHQDWRPRAKELREESGQVALGEAEYMAKRLGSTFAQAELLGLDVATSATRNFNLQSAMNFPVRKPAAAEMADDKFHWPFEQEIWEDELDFVKMKNPSKCAATAAPAAQPAQN